MERTTQTHLQAFHLQLVTDTLSQQQTDYLKNKNAQRVVVFGGKGAVSDELVN